MLISVALCTHNGAAYLRHQLLSIAEQTRRPNEIVVCDDASADDTRIILKDFAVNRGLPLRLFFNDTVLGPVKNFDKAIGLCAGDLIALSDQDDVWLPNKLEAMEKVLLSNEGVGAAFSDAEVVDDKLQPLGYRLWECSMLGPKERRLLFGGQAFELLLVRNLVTGATMAFRAGYRDIILPIPLGLRLWHDGWIAVNIAAVAEVALIDEPLIKYRQHPGQLLGARPVVGKLRALLEEGNVEAWNEGRWGRDTAAETSLRALIRQRLQKCGGGTQKDPLARLASMQLLGGEEYMREDFNRRL